MKYIYISLIGLLITVTSCETQADASELLDVEELTVIHGFVSPQIDTIKIKVARSEPRFGNSDIFFKDFSITDAVVSISRKDGREITLPYNEKSKQYEISTKDFQIIGGESYNLNVTSKGKQFAATCQVPENTIVITSLDFVRDDEFYSAINFKFEDVERTKNFYVAGFSYPTTNFEGFVRETTGEQVFITDTNKDGNLISSSLEYYSYDIRRDTLTDFTIRLANVEPILFDYLKAISDDSDIGNPFSEPIIYPTNIEGENSFGIFAGYTQSERKETYNPEN